MGIIELLLIAVGLSMDAFSVALCKGLSLQSLKTKHYIITGLWFGGFQALMPAIGYLLASTFSSYIYAIDHYIAFILLLIIGINMISSGLSKSDEIPDRSFGIRAMAILAIATSIDALAVGVTFALLPNINIILAVGFIGIITFTLSMLGLKIGNIFGSKLKNKAEIIGGAILILIGTKILLEHLEFLPF